MLRFFDTHTHLDYLADDLHLSIPELVVNAKQAGVQRILVVGVFAKRFENLTRCSQAAPDNVVYGLGLHPLYIEEHQPQELNWLESCLAKRDPHCVAVAEIGLDRAVESICSPELWHKQCKFLEAQLSLAKRYDLPVNLHSRKSHDQLSVFLKKADLPKTGVVHGFAGSYDQAKRFVDLGYKIGVGGTITYERANKTRQAIRRLPLDALLLETDSPDMPVFRYQGQPNRPERVRQIFDSLCQLRSESPEQIAETIWQTSEKLFWLKTS